MEKTAVNWETYLDIFPDRYINPGPFDQLIEETLCKISKNSIHALDVGGGKAGTQVLKKPYIKTWLADPFIAKCPEWMEGNVGNLVQAGSFTEPHFDIIVARGSFNYLDSMEVFFLIEMLAPSGIFLFNTFASAKTGERPYVNSRTGAKGIERYIDEGDTVCHQLIEEGSNTIIEHRFHVYSKDRLELIFAGYDLYLKEKGNSIYGAVKRLRSI